MAKFTSDRSTRLLTELMQEPGNDVCADCKSAAPRWASYNLGIFLCVHCASVHRKLGTHISKVKSINLDQWTKDQIDSIRVTGNLNSNAMYNPNNVNPPVNLHDSERDSELEKFIRNKYQYKTLMSMQGSRAPPPSSRDRYKSSGLGWERMEVGEEKPKEHLTVAPPPRSSSASHPRAASPALTTKSPAPASISPAPPTPSPSIPSYSPAPPAATQPRPLQMLAPSPQPPLQMLAPSPNPPLQMLSPSPNPPLQMLSPSAGMSMQPLQNNFMPGYPSSAYSGSMPSSPYQMTSNLQPSMTNSNPVWQDMAAIQSGPTMPAFQPLMPTGISLQPQMTNSYNPMQGAPTGWGSTGGMMQGVTMAQSPMMMTTSYQPAMNGYQQSNGMTGLQPMYTQNQPMYMMQQQQQQQQIMQPAPMQGMNQMTWMQQGGGYSNGQWQG